MPSLRVALALGSGGARGYAHIGAVEEIRARGHEIVAVAGSSMGALVGGLTAAGHLDEYTAWARSLSQRDVIRLLDPKWSAPGAIAAERITRCRMAGLPPDVLVTVPVGAARSLDFHRAAEMIDLGRTLTARGARRRGPLTGRSRRFPGAARPLGPTV
ncbi:MAG: Patatin [Nocardioides sp.]|jgi:predicted acylesterase/phospholipase RssA|nr:Patatin [Nocardioides sp.]